MIRFINKTFIKIDSLTNEKKIGDVGYLNLIIILIQSNWIKICFALFIINDIANTNLISTVYPLTIFLYANLEKPFPSTKFVNIMILYTIS